MLFIDFLRLLDVNGLLSAAVAPASWWTCAVPPTSALAVVVAPEAATNVGHIVVADD